MTNKFCTAGQTMEGTVPWRRRGDLKRSRMKGDGARWIRVLFWIALVLGLSGPNPDCTAAETLILKNGVIHTVTGDTLTGGSILVRGGQIAEVGNSISSPADKVIDLQGKHVYPGLILPNTLVGLMEIGAVRATRDFTEVGEYSPDVASWSAVNPDSELIPVARANGISHILPTPMGGIVTGTSGLMALSGWTTEEMTVARPVALHLFWPEMELNTTPKEEFADKSKWKSLEDQARERAIKLKSMDDFFEEAASYVKKVPAGRREQDGYHPAWEAMRPLVEGRIPLMVHASSERQIRAAMDWADRKKYRMILAGARDAWRVADLLAARKIPVIFDDVFTQPAREIDPYDIHFRAPGILQKAGVLVALSEGLNGFAAANARNLPYVAAQAAAFGLTRDEALRAITINPARILGVADRLGSLEKGKEATLFVASGDILDIRSEVKQFWIAGKEVSLESRHTRLYQKYKSRPVSAK